MKKITLIFLIAFFSLGNSFHATAQKRLTEGTITYDVYIKTGTENAKSADLLDGATNTVYIKGNNSRSEMTSSLGTEITLFDAKNNTANIIKDYGKERFIIDLNAQQWKQHNIKYENIQYTLENEFKTIANYNCQKATAKLTDGTQVTAYFTKDIVLVNNNAQYFNKQLPGLMLFFEVQALKAKVTYIANQIDFTPVPLSKFDIPKTGYRILNYKDMMSGKQ